MTGTSIVFPPSASISGTEIVAANAWTDNPAKSTKSNAIIFFIVPSLLLSV
jgi:hypothetical protein